MKILASLLCIFALTAVSAAQGTNGRITGGVSLCANCGVENPVLGAGVGGDIQFSETVSLNLNAGIRGTKKKPGGGFSFTGDTSLRVGRTLFGLGGISVARQHAAHFDKTSTNVFGGVGYRVPLDEGSIAVLTASYFAPDFTSPNKVQGVKVKGELFLKRRIYVAPFVRISRSRCIQGPVGLTDRCLSSEVGVNAGFYFR